MYNMWIEVNNKIIIMATTGQMPMVFRQQQQQSHNAAIYIDLDECVFQNHCSLDLFIFRAVFEASGGEKVHRNGIFVCALWWIKNMNDERVDQKHTNVHAHSALNWYKIMCIWSKCIRMMMFLLLLMLFYFIPLNFQFFVDGHALN